MKKYGWAMYGSIYFDYSTLLFVLLQILVVAIHTMISWSKVQIGIMSTLIHTVAKH